jgi:hypothetical protein
MSGLDQGPPALSSGPDIVTRGAGALFTFGSYRRPVRLAVVALAARSPWLADDIREG